MSRHELRAAALAKCLDPATTLAEILFGLIMTLTFTLGAGILLHDEGRDGARELLIATVGCNLAWGIIDGVLYIVGQLYERNRKRRLARDAVAARDDATAIALIGRELDDILLPVLEDAERRALYLRIVARIRGRDIGLGGVTREDLFGALASCVLVFACSLPAALPFMLMDDPVHALRASNALLIAFMFVLGFRLARHTLGNPWYVGCVLAAIGTLLTLVAIALGG